MRERVAIVLLIGAQLGCGAAVTSGSKGHEPLVCPHDAIATSGGCRCAPGLVLLEGACVGARDLDAYCGTSPLAARGLTACPTIQCPAGDPIDLASRSCVPASAGRAIIARVRPLPDDLTLGCHDGRALVLRGDDVACVALADLCPRATTWDPRDERCHPVVDCGPGQVRSEDGACIGIVTRESGGEPVVDLGRWARAMLGLDGGEGTSRLCKPLAEHTAELDIGPGGARSLVIAIELLFPNNDVTQVSSRVQTLDAASHQILAGAGALPAQSSLNALLVPLRALGGTSDAASATLRVRCNVPGGTSPVLYPRTRP